MNIVSKSTIKSPTIVALKPSYTATSNNEVVNTGTTIQVNTQGNLKIGAIQYKLLQNHFHTPSEESINGKHFGMNVHLVHQDAAGKPAVIGVNFQEGSPNAFIGDLWKVVPKSKGESEKVSLPSLMKLLPKDLNYYTYMGSLTTPPCTEGVRFFILKQPVTISPQQLQAFSKLYPMNARTIQPTNDRTINTSN